jgi:hypothetical protein
MAFRFRLVSPDGDDLGSFITAVPNWQESDEIPRRPGDRLRVVDVVELEGGDEDDVTRALLVVEQAAG